MELVGEDGLHEDSGMPYKSLSRLPRNLWASEDVAWPRSGPGKAAELAGWNRLLFADELGRLKIPVVNLDASEIEAELRAIRGNHYRG